MSAGLVLVIPGGRRLRVVDARSPWRRLHGLLGRRGLGPDEGCLLRPCRAIHTLGLRFPIDVVWLDEELRVLRVDEAVPPGWHARRCPRAYAALELAAGAARALGLTPGSALTVGRD